MRFAATTELPQDRGRAGEPGWPAYPPPGPDWPSSSPRDSLTDGFMLFWVSVVVFLMGCHIVVWFRERPRAAPDDDDDNNNRARMAANQAVDESWQAWYASRPRETTPLLWEPELPPYDPNPPAGCQVPPMHEAAPPPYYPWPTGNNAHGFARRWQSV